MHDLFSRVSCLAIAAAAAAAAAAFAAAVAVAALLLLAAAAAAAFAVCCCLLFCGRSPFFACNGFSCIVPLSSLCLCASSETLRFP